MNQLYNKFVLLIFLIVYIDDMKRNKPTQYFVFRHTIGDNQTPLNTIFNRILNNREQPLLNNDMIPVQNRINELLRWSSNYY